MTIVVDADSHNRDETLIVLLFVQNEAIPTRALPDLIWRRPSLILGAALNLLSLTSLICPTSQNA
jgi:hypothetical protein